ncbi:MAG: hypothetical protein II998_08205 [Clostridia bacterium]|nr:hypothetical protein [Clostridia bacterium]
MKKIICLLSIVLLMLSMTVTAFAGDVPEALGYEDDAMVFVGTLIDYSASAESESEILNAKVMPVLKIKGDVEPGKSQTYDLCYFGSATVQKGKDYLFGWLSDSSVWVYEIESNDENGIKLKNTDEFSERIQDYLDEGLYERLEEERSSIGEQICFADYIKESSLTQIPVHKVIFRYNGGLYEIEKEKFFEIANEIMITNVKNEGLHDENAKPKQPDSYETNLYIELVDENEQLVSFAAVSRHGEVDKYGEFMSRLMNKDYEMEPDDLKKLYSLLPQDVQQEITLPEKAMASDGQASDDATEGNSNKLLIAVGATTVVAVAIALGFVLKRKKKASKE